LAWGGSFAVPTVAGTTGQLVSASVLRDGYITANGLRIGVLLRYTDTSNFLFAGAEVTGNTDIRIRLIKRVAASSTILADKVISTFGGTQNFNAGIWYVIQAKVDTFGRAYVWWGMWGTDLGVPILSAQDSALATAGTLASGKGGLYDAYTGSAALTRRLDDFLVAGQTTDAAVFANQALEIRRDRVQRSDATGSLWAPVGKYEGSYLRVPPAAQELRPARFLVKASRGDPDTMTDPAVDDLTAQFFYTPRGL
jgi:hypothetical protein